MYLFRNQKKFIGLGLILLSLALGIKVYSEWQNWKLSFVQTPIAETSNTVIPEKILIPKINLDINIKPAKIGNGVWEISADSASYLVGSVSNMIIYGHNKDYIFGRLNKIKPEDEIILKSKDKDLNFKVKEILVVNPDRIDLLEPTKDKTLTVYTCTGFLDTQRLVIIAKQI